MCIRDSIIPYLNEDIAKTSIFSFIINDLKLTIGFSEKYIFAKPLSKEDQELLNLEPVSYTHLMIFTSLLYTGKTVIASLLLP